MDNKTIVALVPMRHKSVRVPGKNYRPIAGKPLYHHILERLLACPYISKVAVDTDSPIIMNGLKADFPSVVIIERPVALSDDKISTNEILMFDVSQIPADFYLQTHTTNPLLTTQTISQAIQSFLAAYPTYDSLFSVTKLYKRFWDQLGRPVNHNPSILLRTQDLPPIFEENSCMYLFTPDNLIKNRNRLGIRPYMFEMDPLEAWDIDEEIDFLIADILLTERQKHE